MDNDKYIEELKERDKAMPVQRFHLVKREWPICPKCKYVGALSEDDQFCRKCGQRVDMTNWQL